MGNREEKRSDRQAGRQDQYRVLFERSADAILIIDGDRFIDCNDATVRMLRYATKDELLQTHPSELSPEFQPDGRPSYDKANEMIAIAFERGSHRFEWNHRRADGEVFPVEVLLTAVPEGDKHILHVVWRDITGRKQLEEELRHAQKMEALGKLAGGVAHDFNNLLVAILGYADLLTDELNDRPRLEGYVREIDGAARRAADLTAQLLAFGRKQVLMPEVVDLREIVEEMTRLIQQLLGERIALEVRSDLNPAWVVADPGQIERAILNIAANARDAMPDGGNLTVETTRVSIDRPTDGDLPAGDYVRLRFVDTGEGMTPEVQARAFDPFFTSKQRGRGTGLGLASVYGIVKQSAGEIRLDSEPGGGTTVEILFPYREEGAARPRGAEPRPSDTRRGRETILVVEDEPAVAGLIRQVLGSRGYRVVEAADGREALDRIDELGDGVDFVLTDVVMPSMNGPEMVRHLRRRGSRLPVLFMSGYTDDKLAEHGFDPEAVNLIRKPFTPATLAGRIEELLDALRGGS